MNLSIHSFEFQKRAPQGFYVALRVGFAFPMAEQNAYPPEWIEIYTQQGFMLHDPVLKWIYDNDGWIRWSDINLPDPRKILAQAEVFGMKYGIAVSCSDDQGGLRSFGTFAREDREFDDEEIRFLSDALGALHSSAHAPSNLTEAELEVLRLMRDGYLMKQIADEIGVSLGAIKQRLKNAKAKLGAKTSSQAIALSLEYGIL